MCTLTLTHTHNVIFWCDCVVMSADYKVLCLYAQSSIFMYLIGCVAACVCLCLCVCLGDTHMNAYECRGPLSR